MIDSDLFLMIKWLQKNLLSILIILSLVVGETVLATSSSTNFGLNQEEGGPVEANISSTNYIIKAEVGSPVAGKSISSNYSFQWGSIWQIEVVSLPTTPNPLVSIGGGGPRALILTSPPPTPPTTTSSPSPPIPRPLPSPISTPAPTLSPPTPSASSPSPSTITEETRGSYLPPIFFIPSVSSEPEYDREINVNLNGDDNIFFTINDGNDETTERAVSITALIPDGTMIESIITDETGREYPLSNVYTGPFNLTLPDKPGLYRITLRFFDRYGDLIEGSDSIRLLAKEVVVEKTKQEIDKTDNSKLSQARSTINSIKEILEKINPLIKQINEIIDNPEIESIAKNIVAPIATTAAVAMTISLLWTNLLVLLRFLFLEPLRFFGLRRPKAWGEVYNSLTKLPIDLAIVRLVDNMKNMVVESKVTDQFGRYFFLPKFGDYKLEVIKNGFIFPSLIMWGSTNDDEKGEIYRGDTLNINDENKAITINLALDPREELVDSKLIRQLKRKKLYKKLNILGSWTGFIATTIAFIVKPTILIASFIGIHLLVQFIIKRFAKPKKPKSYGSIKDKNTGKPIKDVIVRLYSKQYNKLISTQITENKGTYAFMVGRGQYYLTYEKAGFETQTVSVVIKPDTKEAFINSDVMLSGVT